MSEIDLSQYQNENKGLLKDTSVTKKKKKVGRPKSDATEQLTFYISKEEADWVKQKKGLVNTSPFLRSLLQKIIKEDKKNSKK